MDRIYGVDELMGKTITGIGHKPWQSWETAQPALIADGEMIFVTREAYETVKHRHLGNGLADHIRIGDHSIWEMDPVLFDDWYNDTTEKELRSKYELGELVQVRDEQGWKTMRYVGYNMIKPGVACIYAVDPDIKDWETYWPDSFDEIKKTSNDG